VTSFMDGLYILFVIGWCHETCSPTGEDFHQDAEQALLHRKPGQVPQGRLQDQQRSLPPRRQAIRDDHSHFGKKTTYLKTLNLNNETTPDQCCHFWLWVCKYISMNLRFERLQMRKYFFLQINPKNPTISPYFQIRPFNMMENRNFEHFFLVKMILCLRT